ncbi:MAG: phospho-N-acetylmuramoyl-pentapeptide-transferase [Oscillospiraceae bacterium]|jgi:phospho-N-acetylmuramoyl-pentapeptide-transferase|nr:phospho-N-acetylmuramoyl-pentapeptide-transferase [Oscillospiraceae bacterium]
MSVLATTAFAFGVSLVVTVIAGLLLVPFLRRVKAGQSIRADGPAWHKSKSGTPTLGGLMFIFGITAACLTAGYSSITALDLTHIFALAFALIFGVIGFLDDYEKVKKKQNLGLTSIQKFILQLVAAIAFVLLMRFTGRLTPNLYIPFFNVTFPLAEPIYLAFAAFIIVGCVNAVNITDGIDGLATGVSIPVAAFFVVVATATGARSLGVFAAALLGGLVGFLCFNFHPAKIFMGDTGSLFLGGAICALAFAADLPLILITLGIVYIAETLSDILQVAYFKYSRRKTGTGKRLFKMAPLHHHFEMSGWSEYKVFGVFTAASLVFAAISYVGVMMRYRI